VELTQRTRLKKALARMERPEGWWIKSPSGNGQGVYLSAFELQELIAAAERSTVYVVDAWDQLAGESFISVFANKHEAKRALVKLVVGPGDWFAGVVKRKVR
jgi:hypothetical protein